MQGPQPPADHEYLTPARGKGKGGTWNANTGGVNNGGKVVACMGKGHLAVSAIYTIPRVGGRSEEKERRMTAEGTGDGRQETGDRRQETGDRRQETGDRGQGKGGRRKMCPTPHKDRCCTVVWRWAVTGERRDCWPPSANWRIRSLQRVVGCLAEKRTPDSK
jgi:hypothetical protein